MRKRITLLVAALMLALTMSVSGLAFATHKGTAHGNQTVVQECETPSGTNQPPGQQPVCQGGGLEQEEETTVGQGNAPPGQNK
jgi:hypothetical protein